MEVSFLTGKLAKLCNSEAEMRAKLGPRMAQKLKTRLAELAAAETLEDMRQLPVARCHELTQDRKGQLAVDLVHPKRLVFEPAHNPIPRKEDKGFDWSKVTCIRVLGIIDYH